MAKAKIVKCPVCESPRIISVRHDGDWGGKNLALPVNKVELYSEGDLDENGYPPYGDIKIFECLNCGYVWKKDGIFKFPGVVPVVTVKGGSIFIDLVREKSPDDIDIEFTNKWLS